MKTINAAITPMQEVRLFGEPALFTPERVSRDTVHLGLFPYELETEPFALKERAEDGRLFGTVLALEPLQEQPLAPGDFQADLALGRYRPAAFEERYSPWAGRDL